MLLSKPKCYCNQANHKFKSANAIKVRKLDTYVALILLEALSCQQTQGNAPTKPLALQKWLKYVCSDGKFEYSHIHYVSNKF